MEQTTKHVFYMVCVFALFVIMCANTGFVGGLFWTTAILFLVCVTFPRLRRFRKERAEIKTNKNLPDEVLFAVLDEWKKRK